VTYPSITVSWRFDHFLINPLRSLIIKGYSAERTPYPQKRQQCLGVNLTVLWKTRRTRYKSAFSGGFYDDKGSLAII
jgi:hypothetical protein